MRMAQRITPEMWGSGMSLALHGSEYDARTATVSESGVPSTRSHGEGPWRSPGPLSLGQAWVDIWSAEYRSASTDSGVPYGHRPSLPSHPPV